MNGKHAAAILGVLLIGLGVSMPATAQYDEQYAAMQFVVVRDYNGKPVKNASVIMHPVKKGKQQSSGFQLKTNAEGKTSFDGIPYGPLRVQVLAQGFQTFGEDYEVNQPEMEITVKLRRPQEQYSIYENGKKVQGKPPEQKPEQSPEAQKPEAQKPEAQKPQ